MSDNSLPETVQKRIKIAKLFYPLDRNEERKFARIFQNGFEALQTRLEPIANELDFIQDLIEDEYILWKDPNSKLNECMFCIINDPSIFYNIKNVIKMIESYNPTFTYAIIHQWKEGEGTYDIFRLSKFSYFEHCNRVKMTKSYKK